ncbi:MAG: HIT domain-containing protein [Candidatus Moranbacteria bacterium]|nr:HIT domain-containing protein [Candidatus Moranbacteria bacterium]
MENCIFCKIIKGELPCSKIYEDDEVFAFMDIRPINPGHVLVIPKKHEQLMTELDDKIIKKLIVVGNMINRAIRKSKVKSEGLNFHLSDGQAAGQEIFHVHLHLIPRFPRDGFGLVFPKRYKDKPKQGELDQVAKDIRSKLEN